MQPKVLNAPGEEKEVKQQVQQQRTRQRAPGAREEQAELDENVLARPPGAQGQHKKQKRRTSPAREPF